MKHLFSFFITFTWLWCTGQETAPQRLRFSFPELPPLVQPALPATVSPGAAVRHTQPSPATDLTTRPLADSLHIYALESTGAWYSENSLGNGVMNPFSSGHALSGTIARIGDGYLSGSSSFITRPALGNVASASLSLSQTVDERLSFSVGLSGNKYHMGRDAWNDYGVFARASYHITDRLTINAFGQHYFHPTFHSVGAMPFVSASAYGGTLGYKISDRVSLDVGVQRYYDPYTGRWKTLPIVAPTIQLAGTPISVDVGGFLYQILHAAFGNKQDYYTPGNRNLPALPIGDPGFNPNSPVRIPDCFRR